MNVFVRRQSSWSQDVSVFHDRFIARMHDLPGPLGFDGAEWGEAPTFGLDRDGAPLSSACYNVKGRMRGIKFVGTYRVPDPYGSSGPEKSAHTYLGDDLEYEWKLPNAKVDYRFTLHTNLPEVIDAFEGRFATVTPGYYDQAYRGGYHGDHGPFVDDDGYSLERNGVFNGLAADPRIDVDGWNNIYTLYPAQFWEGQRCVRALGYAPDEVIRRLSGQVPLVRPLRDGIYLVLNDDPAIDYDDFLAMNQQMKPLLGLV